jgi:hypothetical protein
MVSSELSVAMMGVSLRTQYVMVWKSGTSGDDVKRVCSSLVSHAVDRMTRFARTLRTWKANSYASHGASKL